jgi:hypothetical protein
MNSILLYIGAALPVLWGIAHLFPTKNMVRDFGDIPVDNRHIITMEWINEGAALIFIGILVAAVTFVDADSAVSCKVYWLVIIMLNALSVISLLTGFKVKFLPFKLCPLIFTTSSIVILAGMYL